MRIIGGKYKGRYIKMPSGIRPTQNKVRKAIFDIIGDMRGLSFLELFAGSGAVGLEAASQGAREVVMAEDATTCVPVIKKNITSLGEANCILYPFAADKTIKLLSSKRRRFDIIFLDPPYYWEEVKKTLQILAGCDILAPNGFIVTQHFKKDNLPERLGDLVLFKQNTYGDTILSFYRKEA
ncbi:MAG: 16S rRNA (guanine(966)-N(2))-methyltransferase RsmD [Candidatus Omnitrophica bacterium]|nr:16S rRNA (guanine(966)-N(2))-methyltransferase RsmD [Candidatus Omnitrophota bacterium]